MTEHRGPGPARRTIVIAVALALGVVGTSLGLWVWNNHSGDGVGAAASLEPGGADASPSSGVPGATTTSGSAATPTGSVAATSAAASTARSSSAAAASARPTATSAATSSSAGASSARSSALPALKPTTSDPVRPPSGSSCTAPVFTTSDTSGGWSTAGYYVHNNVWNASEAGPETLHACSYRSWYVTSKQRDLASNRGSVKAYPNVHKDYNGERISSFSRITSDFAATSPHLGIYNVAYDVWLNGIADSNSTEVMIWTENWRQVPSGGKVANATFDGVGYDVWKTSDNGYIAFVPTRVMTSGSLDLLQMLTWLMSKGWLAETSTMGQICYGVEVVSTDDTDATFSFTNFSVTSS